MINVTVTATEIVLKGDLTSLLNNKRAQYYFTESLNGVLTETQVAIPLIDSNNTELTLIEIRNALKKYEIDFVDSDKVSKLLQRHESEEINFQLFSDKARRIWENDFDIDEFNNFKNAIDKNLPKRTLYPLQFLAAFHIAFSQNCCNFSVPGAGKTSMVYAAYSYLKNLPSENDKKVNKLVIIGPLSSFGPWENEWFECFGFKPESIRLSGGTNSSNRKDFFRSIESAENTPELILISYQSAALNSEDFKVFLRKSDNQTMLVLDEAHKIKNVNGGFWAPAILDLAKYCTSRVVLTGTPTPNGYEDIHNLYKFIWPDHNIIPFNIFQLKQLSENRYDTRIEDLINAIAPFFIRISKKDILPANQFPIMNHKPIVVEMSPLQREIYDFIEKRYIEGLLQNDISFGVKAELTKARFVRLLQASTSPDLLKAPLDVYFASTADDFELDENILSKILNFKNLNPINNKFEVIKNIIEKIIDKGEKVVVWGTFIKTIKDLQEYLLEHNIDSRVLIGEVPVENENIDSSIITREKVVNEFNQPNSSFNVIIANPFAVAESISLHKCCHNAIYFERTFNAAHFIQSKDRIHRVGLVEGTITNYYYILSKDSIDETVHSRLFEKETRMLELIESRDIPLMTANMDYDIDYDSDVKAILRDYVRRSSKI